MVESGHLYSEAIEGSVAPTTNLMEEFSERAERWELESAIHSSPAAKFLHPDYQGIMAMGTPIIPLILKRLKTSQSDWLWALEHLVPNENPAKASTILRVLWQHGWSGEVLDSISTNEVLGA